MNTGIEFILKTIRTSLADLHLMFTHDAVSVDTQYYNDVNLALLQAETSIYEATKRHEKRIAGVSNCCGKNIQSNTCMADGYSYTYCGSKKSNEETH